MSEQLSSAGLHLKELCDNAAHAVAVAIQEMVGTPEGGRTLKMGSDGTPTKRIDVAAESAVLSTLRDSGMGFRVLSEEIGEVLIGEQPDHFLHLDPLDGTFNAIKGIPFYSVSIYISKGDCRFAYIYDLASGRKYYSEKGLGAYAEGRGRLCISQTNDLKDFSISGYTKRPHTGRIVALGDVVRRIRTLGSSSLEMALVAQGSLDAFVDLRGMLRVVDVAAGKLILEEAGGMVTNAGGSELHLDGNMWQKTELIGSNRLKHNELLQLIGGEGH